MKEKILTNWDLFGAKQYVRCRYVNNTYIPAVIHKTDDWFSWYILNGQWLSDIIHRGQAYSLQEAKDEADEELKKLGYLFLEEHPNIELLI